MPARLLIAVAVLECVARSALSTDATKSDPVAYLNRALDGMQSKALNRNKVDWSKVRAEALARASRAQSTVDTYNAIRFALTSLGDHHSSLHLTLTLQALEKERSSDREQRTGTAPSSPYVGRYEPEGHIELFGNQRFAFVVVTKCFPENNREFVEFETKLQRVVSALDRSSPSGWIVDLRGNVGGNMWPMLTGIGPVLGEGDHLGEFFDSDGHSVWRYRNRVSSAFADDGKIDSYPAVDGMPYHMKSSPPVAVLIDRGTGSSGEALTVAFRGRPKTRLFGEHTAGASTVNETFALSDGAALWLTIGTQADRHGTLYPDGLSPDDAIPAGDKALPSAQDPVVQGALRWLRFQAAPQ